MHRMLKSAVLPVVWMSPALAGAAEPSASALGTAQPVLGAGTALQLMFGLALVLAAILLTAWLARRTMQLRPGLHGQLRVLGGLSVGGRERVVLVQVGGAQIVLGVAPGRVQALHVLEQPLGETNEAAAVSGAQSAAPTFAAVLRRFSGNRGENT